MKASLRAHCDNFIINRDILKNTFSWENSYILPVCSSVLTSKGIRAEEEKLRECKALLKRNTSAFSNFRGNVELPVITALACDNTPEEKMRKTAEIYSILKKYFSGSEFLAYTAAVLSDMAEVREIDTLAQRGRNIYKLMRKEHPFLTSAEDSVFAVLMAFCEQRDEELIFDMESCYTTLKPVFSDGNSVQSLSHVLVLAGGDIAGNAQRVIDIYNALKTSGRKYSRYYELAVLGAVAVLPVDISTAVEDILQTDNFLSQQKGYGFWGLDKRTRIMHAAMIVCGEYAANGNASAAAVTGTLAMIAAQQAATCAAIAASVAASSAASSN